MATFLIGLVILLVGGFFYGSFVERIFKPDDRQTPAVKLEDGVDFVPMNKCADQLIEYRRYRPYFRTNSGNSVRTNRIPDNPDRMCNQWSNT